LAAVLRVLVLALALLAAQQQALAHALWHAANPASQSQDEGQARLCDVHSALGSVLGGASSSTPPALAVDPQATHFAAPIVAAPRFSPCSPLSRGPPARSLK
jgi:hypothetical protein